MPPMRRSCKAETEKAVRIQEELGIDVLVHGEFERNDMVEYFGEQLAGFAFTQNGWVQSYGSRYVKPPVIFGDVSRPKPMTVEWSAYAQSLTKRPMKGMLTGPGHDPAMVIRARRPAAVGDLQADRARDPRRGARPREGRHPADPDRRAGAARRPAAAQGGARRLSQMGRRLLPPRRPAGVADETQIHTHMCYCEFNDIMPSIAALDADVISIETSRSDMELLGELLGLQVSERDRPRCLRHPLAALPERSRDGQAAGKARERLAPEQIWVNPDCGLKTRRWEEVKPALENMVEAAKAMRAAIGS